MSHTLQLGNNFGTKPAVRDFLAMIKLNSTSKASATRVRLSLTCAVSVLAACGQGSSASNTTGDAASLADAPPPATALPLATGPAPAYRPAPVASDLPPAPRARLGRVPPADQYAYLNQAYAFSQSLADAPPDYTYDYRGERPWVWQSPDGYYRVAERLPDGVRYFYYAPGASTPYLVQDAQYSYGYSDGQLTVVYGPDGQVLPYDVEARQAQEAGLYLAWAAGLYAAARHDEHVAVSQDRWNAERQAVYADQARWRDAQQRNADWASYSQAHQNDQAHWADQRYERAAEAARFAQAVNDHAALAHAQQAAEDARVVAQSHGDRPPGPAQQGGFDRHPPSAPPVAQPSHAAGDLAGAQRQPSSPPQQTLSHEQALQRQPAAGQAGGAPPHSTRPPTPSLQGGFERREPQAAPQAPRPASADLAAAQRQQALQHQQAAEPANAQAQAQARDRAAMQAQAAAASQRQSERQTMQAQAQARAQQQEAAQAAAARQAAAQVQARQAQARDQQAAARQAEAAAAGRAASDRNAQATAARKPPESQPRPQPHAEVGPAPPRLQAPPAKEKPKPDAPHP
jgi:hypothetical protein